MEDLNSALFLSDVFHERKSPKQNRFRYKIYSFFVDLDELPKLHSSLKLFSYNRKNFYSFYDQDHLASKPNSIRKNITEIANSQGASVLPTDKIFLLTNVRTLGYVFNPVSFYFIQDENGESKGTLIEVGNTFGEQKPYFASKDVEKDFRVKKHFYVSPFIELDSYFRFQIHYKTSEFQINVFAESQTGERILTTTFHGKKISLNDRNLFLSLLKIPFVTVKIIGAIHFQAFKLFFMKVPFIRKNENPEKQIGVTVGNNSKSFNH